MPRMILRIMTAMMVICTVCLYPTQTSAENLSGPERDPIIVNEEENISLTCPMPITTSCDANGIYQTFAEFQAAGGSVVLPDGCEESSIVLTWAGDSVMSQDGCNFVYMREYLLTADCDNTFTCNQLVMLTDTDDPFITNCPTDVSLSVTAADVSCMAAYNVPSDVVAIDGCSAATVTNDADPSGMFPVGTTTVTYTATDGCGNTSTCSFDIIVANSSTLTVSCPSAINTSDPLICDASGITPYADISAFLSAGGTIDGNCSNSGMTGLTLSSNDVVTNITCPYTIDRTYTITDDANNSGSCTQTIIITDETAPTFTIPGDISVDCTLTQDLTVTGEPTNVLDNCDGMPAITYIDKDSVQLSPDCSGEVSFTRSWIVTDICMNSDTIDQMITTIDTVAPIAMCKDTFTLYLDANGDALFVPDSLDNGSTDACNSELIFTTQPTMSFVSCNQIAGEIPVTLIVSDGCGNSSSCDMMLTLLDTMSIVLTSPPNDTVMTLADVPPPFDNYNDYFFAGGEVNDNCLVNNEFILIDADTTAICQLQIVRTYQYTDVSFNTGTATHTIIVTDGADLADNESPVITNVPTQFLMLVHADCTFDTTFTEPTASDDTGINTTYFTISTFVNDTAQVTFVAEDICGNMSDTTFNLIVFDPTSPDILIDDITIMCDSTNAAPIYTSVQDFLTGPGAYVYDCRLDSVSFTHMGDVTQPDGTIKRTYLIDDFTGNTGTEIQNITIIDSTDPEFTVCPTSFSVEATDPDTCTAIVDVPDPVFSDNCNGSLTLTHNSPYGTATDNVDGEYPVGVTVVSYFLEDENGLMDTCTFTITVTDEVDPVIVCPSDTLVLCDFSAYTPATNVTELEQIGGSASDNCEIESITSNIDTLSSTNYNITYTVQDTSGNTASCTHNVMVVDTVAPIFLCGNAASFLVDIELNAPADACEILINIPIPTATDDCDTELTITNSLTGSDNPSGLFMGTTEITWYVEDDFGNRDTCSYNIVVTDATSPLVSNPSDTIVMCSEMAEMVDSFFTVDDVIAAGGSISDNCGVEFFNILTEVEIGEDTIRRTYEVIDSSNNSSTITQTIIIDDTTAPTFNGPATVTIDCNIALDSLEILGTVDSSLFMDNCGEIDTLIYTDFTFSTGSCLANDSIQRVWILTDDSGNESRDTQYIIRIDTTGPVFDMALLPLSDIACGDKLPLIQTLTATDHCTGAIVTVETIPPVMPPNFCIDFEITYRYTATDNCGNTTLDSVSFMRLADDTAPVLVDSMHIDMASSLDTCGLLVTNVPRPIFEDDCSDTIFMTSDYGFDLYPIGTTTVTWTAQNDCGLSSTTIQRITIEDNIPPVVLCQNLNVSLGGDGFAIVQADTLAKSITDNCSHYFANKISVVRLDNPTACMNDGMDNKSVTFCCDDIGKTILVEVKVFDDAGNMNTCTSEITINNTQGISITQGLPNIDISCEFLFDPEDLSIFGSYVTDIADQEDIRIEDSFYDFDSIAGQDGLYTNTCDMITVAETSEFLSGACGRDTIIRFFKFKNGDDSLTIQQFIYRHDVNKFSGNDIMWPANFVWNQCANPAPDTSIAGAPLLINNDYCSQVAVSFKDQLFNYPLTSCPVVKRKWKVIDWCQYDNSNGEANNPGLWRHDQFINVENDVPATILTTCNDTLICAPGNACEATVSLSIAAEDDCMADAQNLYYAYRIDIGNDNNNANDITGTASSFSHQVEAGVHNVMWKVEDRCGNINSTCEYLITVKECKDPTPVCLDGLSINLSGNPSVELWASDINQSSFDNCTAQEDLSISFSSDVNDNLVTFDSSDVGVVVLEMWITDEAGNQSFCTSNITVQNSTVPPGVQGKVATENNIAIPEAMVTILGAEMDDEVMTETDGAYTFVDLDMQNDYQIQVDRDKDYLDGVTTLDLVMIQRHILGLSELDSPYKMIAADIDNSESLTAADLLDLRKLILGINVTLDENTSWRFVSKNESMNDMTDPWPFTEELILHAESSDAIDADFIGVKIGDVNNSAESLIGGEIVEKRNANTLGIMTNDKMIRRDDQVYIDLVSSSSIDLEAMQMTITWDDAAMSLIDIVPIGIDMEDYHSSLIQPGQMTIAWHNISGKNIAQGVPFFQLVMEGNATARLSNILEINSDITSAIAYNTADESMDIDLRFEDAEITSVIFAQNKPNPFLSETTVEFNLPEAMEVTFKVFDGSGKLIYKTTNNYTEGSNALKLGEQLGEYRGILFLKMEAAEFSEVKRMIRIE